MSNSGFSTEEIGYSKSQIDQYISLIETEHEKLRVCMSTLVRDYDILLQKTMTRPNPDAAKFERLRELEQAVKDMYADNQALKNVMEEVADLTDRISDTVIVGHLTADKILAESHEHARQILEAARTEADNILNKEKQTILGKIEACNGQLARLEQEKKLALDEIERIKHELISLTDLRNTESRGYGKNAGADQPRIYAAVHSQLP